MSSLTFPFSVDLICVAALLISLVIVVVVVVVAVVIPCVQSPKKGVGLPPVDDLPPVGRRVPVQEQELEELGIAKKVPEVTVEGAPLVFGDQQIPDHQKRKR